MAAWEPWLWLGPSAFIGRALVDLEATLKTGNNPSSRLIVMSQVILAFFDENDRNLFSTPAHYVPRPGEIVTYRLSQLYREEWPLEVWETLEKSVAGNWEVVRIQQEFRQYSRFDLLREIIYVYVRPVP